MSTVFEGDVVVRGTLRAAAVQLPDAAVGDDQVDGTDPIAAAKLGHQHARLFQQPHGTAAVTERRPVHVAHAAGTLAEVLAGLAVASAGAATVTVDVRKNGTSVLTSPLTLTSSLAAYASLPAVFGPVAYVAGDVFEVVATAAAGGGTLGQGLFVALTFREAAD